MADGAAPRIPRRAVAIGTGLFAVYLIALTGQRALDAYRVRQDVEGVRREIAMLRAHNVELQAELDSPRENEEIERIARQELGLVRPGDRPVVLIWPAGSIETSMPTGKAAGRPDPTWRQWLRLFVDLEPSSL